MSIFIYLLWACACIDFALGNIPGGWIAIGLAAALDVARVLLDRVEVRNDEP